MKENYIAEEQTDDKVSEFLHLLGGGEIYLTEVK